MPRLSLLLPLLSVLSLAALAGCGPPRMVLLDARAEARESRPAWERVPVAAVGFHVRNKGRGTAQSVLIRYEVLAAEPWAGPTSVPPAGWRPALRREPRACYWNGGIMDGEVRYLACDEETVPHEVRVTAVVGRTEPFDPDGPGGASAFGSGGSAGQPPTWRKARGVASIHPDALHAFIVRLDGDTAARAFQFHDVPVHVGEPAARDNAADAVTAGR